VSLTLGGVEGLEKVATGKNVSTMQSSGASQIVAAAAAAHFHQHNPRRSAVAVAVRVGEAPSRSRAMRVVVVCRLVFQWF
jgi:hypothetical protein